MEKFESFIPTRLIFGAGESRRIGKETAKYGRKVLLVIGKGSLKKTGVYEQVIASLKTEKLEVFELAGIDPNPRLSSCLKGADICRCNNIDAVLAVGGGSVLDAAKTIAAAALDEGDIWDVFLYKKTVTKALPLITLVTLAAAGSELNPHAVIINDQTGQKFSLHSEYVYPKVSILDPLLTVTVPINQTVYGAIDIIAHVFEGYLTATGKCPLSDRMVESICKSVIENTEKLLLNPDDLLARSDLMWSSTLACNGYAGAGYGSKYYDGHQIGHELSAAYDLPHGVTLSVLLPGVMKFHLKRHTAKVVQFGERVLGMKKNWFEDETAFALRTIDCFKAWCKKAGAPVTLKEVEVKLEVFQGLAARIMKNPEAANLTKDDILEILYNNYD